MKPYFRALNAGAFLLLAACSTPANETQLLMDRTPVPPVAEKKPHEMSLHGTTRVDNYYWLNQREDQQVLDYLNAENEYTSQVLKPTEGLQNTLFEEIKGRIREDESSVPYQLDGFYYYTRFVEGAEYPIFCRKKGSLEAEEEILADGNKMAEGHSYFSLQTLVSPDHKLLAEITDTVGRRIYDVRIKNLATGEYLPDVLEQMTGNVVWANDNQTLFYSKQDSQTLRSYQIYRYQLGKPNEDTLVYEENDETFAIGVSHTKDRKFLLIGSGSSITSEYLYLDANNPTGDWQTFLPRERGHEYGLDHCEDAFYIRTNSGGATNFRLMKATGGGQTMDHWEEVIPHREDVLLEEVELFKNYLVVEERKGGLIQLRIMPWDGSKEHYLEFKEPSYVAGISINMEYDTDLLRYNYQSLTTPSSTYDYHMGTHEQTLLKQREVLGGFNADDYVTERINAKAADGTLVPISLVYRKDQRQNGKNPILVYGYGSYGISMEAYFRSSIISLMDRGFVYAIAHIRGGQEMGRAWYDNGKMLQKMNTFTDFIACTEHLVAEGYADPDRVFAMGGSAGGLLVGAVMNLRPDLYKGIVAAVPFVDVVTTMLDESIPLTTGEYDEWGNPNEKQYFDYMLSYSPYDQVTAQDYPYLLITTGLHDSQVQYWEPAKWTAKLRELKTDDKLVLMHTNMDAGHGGASGRFQQFKELAMEYAFILDLAGVHE